MHAILVWFAGFFGASIVARIAGLVVFSGISQAMVTFVTDQVTTVVLSGAASEVVAILVRIGIPDAIGILAGAFVLVLTVRGYSVGPSAAITG